MTAPKYYSGPFTPNEDKLVITAKTFAEAARIARRFRRTPQTVWNRRKRLLARGYKRASAQPNLARPDFFNEKINPGAGR